jgi:poly(A) polymerase
MSAPKHPEPEHPATQVDTAVAIADRLQRAGYTAYFAGGCVRDRLLGIEPLDYDIATDAQPDQVIALFPRATAVGKSFGVVVVPWGDWVFEIATFRQDHAYRDGRHPTHVSFVTPEEDATRRDFTINAMFYDPLTDELHDYVDGQADMATGTVRCVGDARRRFTEDHLRMLRAVRFATRFDFAIHPDTASAIREHAAAVANIRAERIRDELTRILMESKKAGQAVVMLEELGLLQVVLPEVAAMRAQEQPPQFHPEGDVLTHTVIMLDAMASRDVVLALAILLHDVGKPATASHDGTRIRFNCHAEQGADMARGILLRLRFPTRTIDAVAHCVRNHMRFLSVKEMRRATLRRLVGAPTFPIELELHRVDCVASHGMLDNYEFLQTIQAEMDQEPVLPDPWIDGHEIMNLGVPKGPQVGKWLKVAYDAQLEGTHADKEALRSWLTDQIAAGRHI